MKSANKLNGDGLFTCVEEFILPARNIPFHTRPFFAEMRTGLSVDSEFMSKAFTDGNIQQWVEFEPETTYVALRLNRSVFLRDVFDALPPSARSIQVDDWGLLVEAQLEEQTKLFNPKLAHMNLAFVRRMYDGKQFIVVINREYGPMRWYLNACSFLQARRAEKETNRPFLFLEDCQVIVPASRESLARHGLRV